MKGLIKFVDPILQAIFEVDKKPVTAETQSIDRQGFVIRAFRSVPKDWAIIDSREAQVGDRFVCLRKPYPGKPVAWTNADDDDVARILEDAQEYIIIRKHEKEGLIIDV